MASFNYAGGVVLTIPAKLLCGGFAGAIAQSFSYPLDVTRRRMQLAMMSADTHKFGLVILVPVSEFFFSRNIKFYVTLVKNENYLLQKGNGQHFGRNI